MTEAGQTGPSTHGEETHAEEENATASGSERPTADAPAVDEPSAGNGPAGGSTVAAGGAAAASATDDDVEELADQEERAYRTELRKGLLLGLGGGLVVGVIVALVLGAFVWPGYLLGPGSPDDTAQRTVAALASKDPAALDQVSCRTRTGQATTQIPAQALQLVGRATGSGPTTRTLDYEARAPVDLVLAGGGQSQTLPTELVLNVNDGSWCLNGLAQRQ